MYKAVVTKMEVLRIENDFFFEKPKSIVALEIVSKPMNAHGEMHATLKICGNVLEKLENWEPETKSFRSLNKQKAVQKVIASVKRKTRATLILLNSFLMCMHPSPVRSIALMDKNASFI